MNAALNVEVIGDLNFIKSGVAQTINIIGGRLTKIDNILNKGLGQLLERADEGGNFTSQSNVTVGIGHDITIGIGSVTENGWHRRSNLWRNNRSRRRQRRGSRRRLLDLRRNRRDDGLHRFGSRRRRHRPEDVVQTFF